jgi:hypothetical protein
VREQTVELPGEVGGGEEQPLLGPVVLYDEWR